MLKLNRLPLSDNLKYRISTERIYFQKWMRGYMHTRTLYLALGRKNYNPVGHATESLHNKTFPEEEFKSQLERFYSIRSKPRLIPQITKQSRVGLVRKKAVKTEKKENPIQVIIVNKWSWKKFLGKVGVGAIITVSVIVLANVFLSSQIVVRSGVGITEIQPTTVGNTVTFADVQGVEDAKSELEDIVMFLKEPNRFLRTGGKMPKGIILYGPPGTGKTYLAKAVSGEAGVPFYHMSGSEFDELYVGVGARRIRELFATAKRNAPCIIFIDEIDAIGSKRNTKDHTYMRQTLNQLLVELDGFTSSDGVIFMAATNIPESLDKALIRPGRIDKRVAVSLPDVRGRANILEVHSSNVIMSKDVDLISIARGTPGFSGADLANIINQAAIKASRDGKKMVGMEHIEWAKDNAIMGSENKSAIITEENKNLTAYHESGHAIVAVYTEGTDSLHKVTIIPRGNSLGMTVQLPDVDKANHTKQELKAKLDVLMGGMCAEELIHGKEKVSTGCLSDLRKATDIAYSMVCNFGMSDEVGLISVDGKMDISTNMRSVIEKEVRNLLTEASARAMNLLKSHINELHRLAQALKDHEILDSSEVRKILSGEPIKSIRDKLVESASELRPKA